MAGWLEFTLTAAFLAGLTGGAHCAAMCGPFVGIACAPRAQSSGSVQWLLHALAYNAGRISTYCAAGALTGAVGAAGMSLRGGPISQHVLLGAMSASLVVLAAYVAGFAPLVRGVEAAGAVLWRRIEPCSRRLLPADTPARAFGLGLVWGWLPCGMVYAALLAALATADAGHAALLMAAFGLGTLPNLLAISAWFKYVACPAKSRLARGLAAAVIAGVGVFGIARAAQPAVLSGDGSWCINIPGIAALLGVH